MKQYHLLDTIIDIIEINVRCYFTEFSEPHHRVGLTLCCGSESFNQSFCEFDVLQKFHAKPNANDNWKILI